jgi:hypothetical protein
MNGVHAPEMVPNGFSILSGTNTERFSTGCRSNVGQMAITRRLRTRYHIRVVTAMIPVAEIHHLEVC